MTTDFLPAPEDVGALIPSRTVEKWDGSVSGATGTETGTFGPNTRPTLDQLDRLIAQAATNVTRRLGGSIPDDLADDAKAVIALGTAMLVELGYYGDQIRANTSVYPELKTLCDEQLADLITAWKDLGTDLTTGTQDDLSPAGLPVFSFDDPWTIRAPGSEAPWPADLWPAELYTWGRTW